MILKPPLITFPTQGHPLSRGLVCCFLENESGGIEIVDLANGVIGLLSGSVNWSGGRHGPALDFGGGSVSCSVSPYQSLPNEFSIICGVCVDSLTGYQTAISNVNSSWVQQFTFKPVYNSSGPAVYVYNGGAATIREAGTSLAAGVPATIAGVFEGAAGRLDIYINGVKDNGTLTGSVPASLDSPAGIFWMIGAFQTIHLLDGKLDYLYIYDRAIRDSEVAALQYDPFCMFRRDPIELWTGAMGGVSSRTVLDYERITRGVSRGVIRGAA